MKSLIVTNDLPGTGQPAAGGAVNPLASAAPSPAACRGVSEQQGHGLLRIRIEDSPQLAAESFNAAHSAAIRWCRAIRQGRLGKTLKIPWNRPCRRCRRRRTALGVALVFFLQQFILAVPPQVSANPIGGQVAAGQAVIQQQGTVLTVTQGTPRAVVNWQGFSIGSGETTRFIQPSAQAAILNRVTGYGPSRLDGSLQANGQVFLINPNGVVIGSGGRIETATFVASTLDVPDSAFMAGGDLFFSGDSAAGIRNLGVITAAAGDILLVARTVENDGTLRAPEGTVGLAAGNEVLYRPACTERLFVQSALSMPETADGATNRGLIEAAQVELRAAGGNVYALAVNNGGSIHATGISARDGRVLLTSSGGSISNTGTLAAHQSDGSGGEVRIQAEGIGQAAVDQGGTLDVTGTASGARGGSVTITGDTIALAGTSRINASGDAGGGTVLIGGDCQGKNAEIHNAARTAVEAGAEITADALTEGNGGRVVIWSEQETRFQGSIQARGGTLSGDGGFAEVSGKSLLYEGLADLRAPQGRWGTLLLDPEFITITDQETPGGGRLSPLIIAANLNGADVFVDASGNVTFVSGTILWNSPTWLTLKAGQRIFILGDSIFNLTTKINHLGSHGGGGGLALHAKGVEVQADEGTSWITADTLKIVAEAVTLAQEGPYRFDFDQATVAVNHLSVESGYAYGSSPLPETPLEFSMTHSGNRIAEITLEIGGADTFLPMNIDIWSDNTGGKLRINDSSSVALEGNLLIRSAGDLELGGSLVFGAQGSGSRDCTLVAAGSFINESGRSDPIQNPTRLLIYSADPREDVRNGLSLSGRRVYDRSYADGQGDLPDGSWFVHSLAPTLTITAGNATRIYGHGDPMFTYTAEGLIEGDERLLSGGVIFSIDASYLSPVGNYSIQTALWQSMTPTIYGYKYAYFPGTLTVTKAPLTIRANDTQRLYGQDNPVFTAAFDGLMAWDTADAVTGLSLGTNAARTSNAGAYWITPTGAEAVNYNITLQKGILSVDPAPLTITANNASRRIGDANPAFTAAFVGLMDWDRDAQGNPNNGVVSELRLTTDANVASGSGPYAIVPDGAFASNYNIQYVNGILTIREPYQLVITADNKSRIYGDPNPAFTVTYAGFEDGDTASVVSGLSMGTTAVERSPLGAYAITVAGATLPPYYKPVFVGGTLTIDPRTLTFSAVNAGTTYGTAPTLAYTVEGLLPGDALASAPVPFVPPGRLSVGSYPIGLAGGAATNYQSVYRQGTLTVTPAALTVQANKATMTWGEAYPRFTASFRGLLYDDTPGVVSGLNLVPADSYQGLFKAASGDIHYKYIVQEGTLSAANYSITFLPGELTILPKPPEILTVETTTVTGGGTVNGPNFIIDPFGVPPEGRGAIRYVAKECIRNLGLDVADVDAWLADPANRALMTDNLLAFLKAPLKEGTELYRQREIVKTALENQIREMQVQIAKDAVARYEKWKDERSSTWAGSKTSIYGDLTTPSEDFVTSATVDYVLSAISIASITAAVATMVATSVAGLVPVITIGGMSMIEAMGTSAAEYAALVQALDGAANTVTYGNSLISAGFTPSMFATVAGPTLTIVAAVIMTIQRAIQLADYMETENYYAGLVENTKTNFDIDTMLNGDSTALQNLSGLLMATALATPQKMVF